MLTMTLDMMSWILSLNTSGKSLQSIAGMSTPLFLRNFMPTSLTQSNIQFLFEVNPFILPLPQLIAISSCRMLLAIIQHSKRKRTMKLTMAFWRIYVLQIPSGMGDKRADDR
ncbi:hypothetical protein V6N13_010050 [Hibiscus sabdariffa]